VYVELAACRLTALPAALANLIPNVRVLNLNYNFLEDVEALAGLSRLRKLTVIGSRLRGTKGLIRLLQKMPDVEMLDFRWVTFSIKWYPLRSELLMHSQKDEPVHAGLVSSAASQGCTWGLAAIREQSGRVESGNLGRSGYQVPARFAG
jgi:hypothetical protein